MFRRTKSYLLENKGFVLILLFILFLLFFRVGKASINNDAQFWYTRSQNFVKAIKTKDWEETFQNPKPGVTVMWISGFSLDTYLTLYEKVFGFRPGIYNYDTFPLVHLSVIGPLLVVVSIGLVVSYLILSKLVGKRIGIIYLIILGSQPFFIGISRNFHSDASVTIYMLVSALLLIYFLNQRKPATKLLVLSGVFSGLALLSKSAAIFLLPYTALVLVLYYYEKSKLTDLIKWGLIWIASCWITFYILFPAMWGDSYTVLRWIFVDEGLTLLQEGRDGVNGFWYYAEPLFRILTPAYLGAFVVGTIMFAKNLSRVSKKEKLFYLAALSFVIFYLLQMSLVKQKMDRYLLPALPFASIIGAYGLYEIYKIFSAKISYTKFIWVILVLFFSTIIYYFPNYLLYPSIKGRDQFGCSLCSDIGEYLNSQKNPADLKIVSESEKLHRLQPFVRGKVYSPNEKLPNNWTPEYYVSAAHIDLPKEYSACVLEKTIGFRGYDYWEIYFCK